MSESTLLIAFVSFGVLLIVVAIIVRKISVRDIFDDDSSSSPFARQRSAFPKNMGAEINPQSATAKKDNIFSFNKENINKFSKVLSVIGAIILFTPTPDSLKIFGLGMVFLGSMLGKATAPPKKKSNSPSKNSTAQKVRALAGKPEYGQALKLLSADYKDASLRTEEEKYRRALLYLQGKGISQSEAEANLKLLYTWLNRKKT